MIVHNSRQVSQLHRGDQVARSRDNGALITDRVSLHRADQFAGVDWCRLDEDPVDIGRDSAFVHRYEVSAEGLTWHRLAGEQTVMVREEETL